MGASCSVNAFECKRCIETDVVTHSQSTRLVDAARTGDVKAVAEASRQGAAISAPDTHGWTALHYGAAGGHLEVCQVLVGNGCDVNAILPDFSTPLMLAAEEGHLLVAKFLLENGALTKCKDEDGFTVQDRCDKSIEADFKTLLLQPGMDHSVAGKEAAVV
mmetsp:Transcript_48024/g.102906  ORF Transcript_48024/g.102906 Transcript_48024/m.102906 type:complete len:161 (+) Transcript_48024:263-745(+)|eukprot:CAMPEP_0206465942 /NCGR_PEP_ID=MMETSP0324_2-20121206/28149_1 /ASSEMBLY_ACC=CAM_ASM_000836 /TAXON_ID=2866 /ORGANISM="Crypthecodinium cohnii, Strain Seligo" /LENGTH=160 /DNA_ID=CAMNT_0053938935 /DNA_START=178 /DNA_END=660 /DNA_ORIENTATION=-